MLKSTVYGTRTLSVAGILGMLILLIQSNCYAGGYITTISEISVKCSSTFEEAQPQIYPGMPNTYLKLVTKGIKTKIDGQEALIEYQDWRGGDVLVIAKCTTALGGYSWATDMFLNLEAIPIARTLQCGRGEGISVTMYKPNDADPDKYQYVATLITNRYFQYKQPKPMQVISTEPHIEEAYKLSSFSSSL